MKTEQQRGVLAAVAAYLMWGVAPLYFKAVEAVPPIEIVMHRVVWSFGLMLLLVWLTGQINGMKAVLRDRFKMGVLVATSLLIGGNWLIFIWAVTNEHLLQASLGYYISPLFNVALGMLFLQERPSRLQLIAVAVAAVGVLLQLIQFGSVPWVALGLAVTFGLYGLLRKQLNLQASTGLMLETGVLFPIALAYWWMLDTPTADLGNNTALLNALLLSAGIVTALPLLSFAYAAVRIPFFMLGMLQYIGPSLMFIVALTLFDEPLSTRQLQTFAFVWSALLLFSLDSYLRARRIRRSAASDALQPRL